MTEDLHEVDERLARLARATNQIEPGPRFHDGVMAAVRLAAAGDWRVWIWQMGRYGLALSTLAVMVATVLAMRGAALEDEQQAVAYGTVDVEW